MAKKGIELKDLTPIIRERCKTSGWALCVGAGTSTPAFPSWEVLVTRLVERDAVASAPVLMTSLVRQFSYDALIQAAKDRLGLSEKRFENVLTSELYSGIKNVLSKSEWQQFTTALSSVNIGLVTPDDWKSFISLTRKYFHDISALPIAEIISEVIETKESPAAIMSFNAEPLLVTLINAFASARSKKQVIDFVTHGISNRKTNRVPYYFCHGLLPVPVAGRKGRAHSADKLVFSETSYLQLANSAFSWQSSVFIDVCSSKAVVFVGLSLSDPNMRRWLSWIQANKIQELKERGVRPVASTSHYWINNKPTTTEERDWIESSVAHLGVRLVWIHSWSEVGQALRALLGK
jgi:hypothetical protein